MKEFCIIIPAIKKNAVIPDQLVKKLNGETLIQRAINVSKDIISNENIYIITDSQEISLIAERNSINCHHDSNLNVSSSYILKSLDFIFDKLSERYSFFFLHRANAPLVNSKIIKDAINYFKKNDDKLVVSVKKEKRRVFKTDNGDLNSLFIDEKSSYYEEVNAFQISKFISLKSIHTITLPYILKPEIAIEIDGYQSWWICEKILKRKKIVFNVIGSIEVGMGHIYRALSIAHEITDHEVIFVCDEKHEIVVEKIASTDYKVTSCKKSDITDFIISQEPDLVINDILNSQKVDILKFKDRDIRVVNFEDIGSGSQYTDLTINELYESPILDGSNYLWGNDYFFLRDEFSDAKPHSILESINSVLITFGGTDQNNLSKHVLELIIPVCKDSGIKIYVVCGPGYSHKVELESFIQSQDYKDIEFTYSSGVISKIMEKTQLAISSNGRTVYELADMNIPSIIISHHKREDTHKFATLNRGFIYLGVYKGAETNESLKENFLKLIENDSFRKSLFKNITKYSFRDNKSKVLNKILSLIEN